MALGTLEAWAGPQLQVTRIQQLLNRLLCFGSLAFGTRPRLTYRRLPA